MLTSKVAKRYAQGLLNFTQESGNTDSVFTEMGDIVKTIEKSKELQSFFASPIIDVKKKVSIALEIFKDLDFNFNGALINIEFNIEKDKKYFLKGETNHED